MPLPAPLTLFYSHSAQHHSQGLVENSLVYQNPPILPPDKYFYNLKIQALQEDYNGALLLNLYDVEIPSLVSHPISASSSCSVQSALTVFDQYMAIVPLHDGRAFETRIFNFSKRSCTIDETYPTVDRVDITVDNVELRVNDYAPILIIQTFPTQYKPGTYTNGHLNYLVDPPVTSILRSSSSKSVVTILKDIPIGQGRCTLLSGEKLFSEPTDLRGREPYTADEVIVQSNTAILINDLKIGGILKAFEINYPNIDKLFAAGLIKAPCQIQITSPTRGFLPTRFIDRSMSELDPYTIGLSLLNACNYNDPDMVISVLIELIDLSKKLGSVINSPQNPTPSDIPSWGFPQSFSRDSQYLTYKYKPVADNAWLGICICHSIKFLQDRLPIGNYKLYGSYPQLVEHLKAVIKSLAYLCTYSISPTSNWCAERLDLETFNYSSISLKASYLTSIFLSEYLELDYDFFIHTRTAALYNQIVDSPKDPTDDYYQFFLNANALLELPPEQEPVDLEDQTLILLSNYYDFFNTYHQNAEQIRLLDITVGAFLLEAYYQLFINLEPPISSPEIDQLYSNFFQLFSETYQEYQQEINSLLNQILQSYLTFFSHYSTLLDSLLESNKDLITSKELTLQDSSYRCLWEAKFSNHTQFLESVEVYEQHRNQYLNLSLSPPPNEYLQTYLIQLADQRYNLFERFNAPKPQWAQSRYSNFSRLANTYLSSDNQFSLFPQTPSLKPDLHPTAWDSLTQNLYPILNTPPFNLYSHSAESKLADDLQLFRKMWGYGQFWTSLSKELDFSSNIGSLFYSESSTRKDWHLIYNLIRNGIDLTRAQGPALLAWEKSLYLQLGMGSDFFRRNWLTIYNRRPKDSLPAIANGLRRLFALDFQISQPAIKPFNKLEDLITYPDNFDSYSLQLTPVQLPYLSSEDMISITFRPGPDKLEPREIPGFTYLDISCDEASISVDALHPTNFNVTSYPLEQGYSKQGPVLVDPLSKYFPIVDIKAKNSPPDNIYKFIRSTAPAGILVKITCTSSYKLS